MGDRRHSPVQVLKNEQQQYVREGFCHCADDGMDRLNGKTKTLSARRNAPTTDRNTDGAQPQSSGAQPVSSRKGAT
jgi:hypothetical protein